MIVITNVDFIEVDDKKHLLNLVRFHPSKVAHWDENPIKTKEQCSFVYQNDEVKQEIVQGFHICTYTGEEICLGVSSQAADVLKISYALFQNLQNEKEVAVARKNDLKSLLLQKEQQCENYQKTIQELTNKLNKPVWLKIYDFVCYNKKGKSYLSIALEKLILSPVENAIRCFDRIF